MTPQRAARLRRKAAENAFDVLKLHPGFSRVQVEVLEKSEDIARRFSEHTLSYGSDERLNAAIQLLNIRCQAYSRLISDMRSLEAYLSIVTEFGLAAFHDHTGFPIEMIQSVASDRGFANIQERVRHWTREGYKVLDDLTSQPTPTLACATPAQTSSRAKRFRVAFSFPGEARPRVEAIADRLASVIGRSRLFYDNWYKAELARPNLDLYLQDIYRYEAELCVRSSGVAPLRSSNLAPPDVDILPWPLLQVQQIFNGRLT